MAVERMLKPGARAEVSVAFKGLWSYCHHAVRAWIT